MRRGIATTALLLVIVLLAACGQKPGVISKIEGPLGGGSFAGGLPPGSTVDEEGNILDAEGNVIGNVEEGITDPDVLAASGGSSGGLPGSTDPGSAPGSSGPGSTDPGSTDPGEEGPSGPPPSGSTTTGVTNNSIKIGIHAPLSGAAPVPSDSVDAGKDLYFRFMAEKGQDLFGRNISVVLKNDQYNPSTAVAVCKEMVEKDQVFLLSGAAGTDQIQACARYAESVGVPYISAGVTESLVSGFRTYFTTSMTYPDQAPLLVQYMVNKLGAKGEKNGMLFFDTASFKDAHDTFKAEAAKAGLSISYDRQVSKTAGTSEARQVVQEMQLAQIENVFVLTSPVWWLNVLKQADTQAYRPQWVGVGITKTFDTVASVACRGGTSVDGAKFFSPFPAWIDSDRYDPDFRKASASLTDKGQGDDFMWLSWIAGKTFWEFLKAAGKDLTRENFILAVEKIRNLNVGVGPPLSYSSTDHFGASSTYVSEARCATNRWHTIVTSPATRF